MKQKSFMMSYIDCHSFFTSTPPIRCIQSEDRKNRDKSTLTPTPRWIHNNMKIPGTKITRWALPYSTSVKQHRIHTMYTLVKFDDFWSIYFQGTSP